MELCTGLKSAEEGGASPREGKVGLTGSWESCKLQGKGISTGEEGSPHPHHLGLAAGGEAPKEQGSLGLLEALSMGYSSWIAEGLKSTENHFFPSSYLWGPTIAPG